MILKTIKQKKGNIQTDIPFFLFRFQGEEK